MLLGVVRLFGVLFQVLGDLGWRAVLEVLRSDLDGRNEARECLEEGVDLFLARVLREIGGDQLVDLPLDPFEQHLAQRVLTEHRPAVGVDHLALAVHHVVVFDDVLAEVEVVRLDLPLGRLDGFRHQPVLQRHVLLDAEAVHQVRDRAAAEASHEVVFERDVETGRSWVALAPGSAPQLVVDASGLVPLGADDVQTS